MGIQYGQCIDAAVYDQYFVHDRTHFADGSTGRYFLSNLYGGICKAWK